MINNIPTISGKFSLSGIKERISELFTKISSNEFLFQPGWAFILSRLIVLAASFIGHIMLPTDPGHWTPPTTNLFVSLFARWDSQWYFWIIQEGYWLNPGQRSNVAFFPLYPLIVDLVKPVFGGDLVMTSVIISNVAFYFGLVFLYLLTELEFGDRRTARLAVFYLAVFPTSFFFSAMYTESLFLLFTIGAVYFGRRQAWSWAAVMGILASATRVVGVLTWGIVMWEWLRVHGWTINTIQYRATWRRLFWGIKKDWFQIMVIATIPLGLISYMVFLKVDFGDPMAFATVQSAWNRINIGPAAVVIRDLQQLIGREMTQGNTSRLLNLVVLFGGLGLGLYSWRKLGAGYGLFVLVTLLLPSSSSSQSILRYALVSFPIFMILGHIGRNKFIDRALTISFAGLLGLFSAVFVNWIFVA